MGTRKSGKKNPAVIGVHTGKMLAEKIKEQRLSKAELARRIKRPSSAIKPLLSRPSMQAYLLWELSLAMDFDFFSPLSNGLVKKQPAMMSANSSDKVVISALEKELAALRQERDYLKKMIDILANSKS